MKQQAQSLIQLIKQDRGLMITVGLLALLTVVLIIVQAIMIEPNTTQVITQYSSYGITGFYRNYWYSLWAYTALQVIILVGHSALALKMVKLDRRALALPFLCATGGVLVMVFLYAQSISKIAALG